MKKLFLSILTMIYMVVSSGIAMEIHYCMGKQAGIEFYASSSDKCGKCGMKEKKGCCNDEHKFYKLNDSHKTVVNDIQFEPNQVAVVTDHPVFNFTQVANKKIVATAIHAAPDLTGPSLNIRNCVFRI
jgi:hypothetical protein